MRGKAWQRPLHVQCQFVGEESNCYIQRMAARTTGMLLLWWAWQHTYACCTLCPICMHASCLNSAARTDWCETLLLWVCFSRTLWLWDTCAVLWCLFGSASVQLYICCTSVWLEVFEVTWGRCACEENLPISDVMLSMRYLLMHEWGK